MSEPTNGPVVDTAIPSVNGHTNTPANGLVVLGSVDAAYVLMIEGEYRGALLSAQQLRAQRLAVVFEAHGVPEGSTVSIVPSAGGEPMRLEVIPPAPASPRLAGG